MAVKKPAKRKFAKVPKTKGGVPKKYVAGAKNPKAREREIKRSGFDYMIECIFGPKR